MRVPVREESRSVAGRCRCACTTPAARRDTTFVRACRSCAASGYAARGGVTEVARSYRPAAGERRAMPPVLAERMRTALRGTGAVTQLHYARTGIVTPEMEFIAIREGFEPGFVRDEIARGQAGDRSGQTSTVPNSADDHRRTPLVKINANIGNSTVQLVDEAELDELPLGDALGRRYQVIDLSTDRDIHENPRESIVADCAGADRHGADLPGAERPAARRRTYLVEIYPPGHPRRAVPSRGSTIFTVHAGVLLRFHPDDDAAYGMRLRGGLDPGEVVSRAPSGVLLLHALPRIRGSHDARLRHLVSLG